MTTSNITGLLASFDDGDEEAKNQIMTDLLPNLREVARKLLGRFPNSTMDVDELVNDFYHKTFAKITTRHFNDSNHFIATAFKRMYWTILDEFRHRKMVQPGTHQLTEEALTGTGIATRVAEDNLIEIAWSALEELPENLRSVVQQRLTGGLTYKEISEDLDIGQSTAHDRFERAIEQLRKIVGADADE